MLMRSPAERVQLPAELEGSLALVNEWLVKIAGGENPELDLRNLRAVLLNVLKMVKAESSIAAAVDEVFEAALAYQGNSRNAAKAGTDAGYRFVLGPGGVGDGALRSGGEQPGERANKRRSDGRSSTSEAPRVRGTSTGVKMRALRHSSTRGRDKCPCCCKMELRRRLGGKLPVAAS
jgi:hypothetical protein